MSISQASTGRPRGGGGQPDVDSTAGSRGRLPRSARRAQLMLAAEELFVASGYHQAAMDDIAERAGVSKPVLYQHFPSKLELYLALVDSHGGQLVRRVQDAMSSTADNKERVYAAVSAYFDFVDSDTGAFRLIFESDLRNEAQVAERVRVTFDACVDAIADTITADTGLDDLHARFLAVTLVGVSEASARGWLAQRDVLGKEVAIELVAALCWRGISHFPLTGASADSGQPTGLTPEHLD